MTNFQQRTLTTIIGGAIMIAVLIIGRELLLAVLLALALIGYHEMASALGVNGSDHGNSQLMWVGYLSVTAWYLALELIARGVISDGFTLGLGVVILVISLLVHMGVYVFTFPGYKASQTVGSVFSVIYPAVMLSFLYMIRSLDVGVWIVWYVLICSWICDICAYLVGIKIGRHKMSPKLSPKKSIEGAVGGVAGSALIGGIYAAIAVAPRLEASTGRVVIIFVIMSILGALISMVGDLAASAIKRDHGIKDYGHIIPGHGGVMDRFDSFVFVAPLVYILCIWLL